MTTLDRRTFLRGIVYGLLGAVLGWGVEAIAAEAAPEEEEYVTSGYAHMGVGCAKEPSYTITTYPENGWATFDVTKKGDKE